MPITEIETPDGEKIGIEHPEGATDAEILAYAQENYKPQSKPITREKAYQAGIISGVPFGADIAGGLAAATYGRGAEGSFLEKQRAAKQFFEERAQAGAEQYPGTSLTGALATGLPLGMLIPQGATSGASAATRALKGAGVAGAMGAAYGAGSGQGTERISNAIQQGVMSAPFGAAGSLAVDAIGAGYRATRGLAKRAAELLNPAQRPVQNITIQGTGLGMDDVQRALQQAPDAQLSGQKYPLSQGQATQNPKLLSQEIDAAGGVYGEKAQQLMTSARDIQSTAAKTNLGLLAGRELTPDVPLSAADDLKAALSQSYKAAKAKTSEAYKAVGALSEDAPLQIAKEYIDGAVLPSIKDWARKGSAGRPWDLGADDMKNAKRLYDQAQLIGRSKKITAVNFFRMEDWRGRVSQGIANSKTPSEKAFLSGMLQRYDTAMAHLPREAIKNGDDAILAAMEKARGARKAQGVLFERSKFVKDILEQDKLTNEQFYNTISSLGNKSGAYVRDILRTAANEPEKQAVLRQHLRKASLGSILNNSMTAEVKAGSAIEGGIEKMVSFDKLATNLNKLISNKTLFNQLFPDAAERKAIEETYRWASLIKSKPPGVQNSSNTYTKMLSFLRNVSPEAAAVNVLGVGVGSSLKAMEREAGQQAVEKSLAPILKGISDEASGPLVNFAEKYGRGIILNSAALKEQVTKQNE